MQLRPKWLFGATVHEGCDRAGYYEQGDFAEDYNSPKCLVKVGCWGPVVNCNVPKRGWMAGIGGCPNVGGICIGCTMPGFPDKFMPFMDEPPGARLSAAPSESMAPRFARSAALPMPLSTKNQNGGIPAEAYYRLSSTRLLDALTAGVISMATITDPQSRKTSPNAALLK